MTQKKYSIDEMDKMREHIKTLRIKSLRIMGNCPSYADEHTMIEETLRTYMLNGTAVDELEEAARKHVESLV